MLSEFYFLFLLLIVEVILGIVAQSSLSTDEVRKMDSFPILKYATRNIFSKYSFETQLEAFGRRGRLGPPAMTSAVSAWRSGTEPASGSYLTRYVDNARKHT